MSSHLLRDRLHRDIDMLPENILAEVADFTAFLVAKREAAEGIGEWTEEAWREFALGQFLREADDDDVEYTLDDAEEVYRR